LDPNPERMAEDLIRLLSVLFNNMSKLSGKNGSVPEPSSLTHLQLHVLDELVHEPEGMAMTRLARRIRIAKQQLTPLVKKLEELAYVERTRNPRDRRSYQLVITDQGKEAAIARWEEFRAILSDRIASLGEDDRMDLDFAVRKIIRIFSKMES